MTHLYLNHPARQQLISTALEWESHFSVLPRIGDVISEFDAAMLVGHTPKSYEAAMQGTTAVQKGFDFKYKLLNYQVKHNRPSGKKGSKVTNAGKVDQKCHWDILIYVLYDRYFNLQEVWQWRVEDYKSIIVSSGKVHVSLKMIQSGRSLL
jgi:hypothetical protein